LAATRKCDLLALHGGPCSPALVPLGTFQTVSLEKLSEKGYEQHSDHGFGPYTEREMGQKPHFGGPEGYAVSASRTFRTVSRNGVLGSSRFAGIVLLSQEGGMGVARLKDSPPSEAKMIAECEL
jgi:hypothetical protein